MAEDEDYLSSSDLEGEDCYLTDQEDAIEENVLQGLEDGREEDCHWSLSSVWQALVFSFLIRTCCLLGFLRLERVVVNPVRLAPQSICLIVYGFDVDLCTRKKMVLFFVKLLMLNDCDRERKIRLLAGIRIFWPFVSVV